MYQSALSPATFPNTPTVMSTNPSTPRLTGSEQQAEIKAEGEGVGGEGEGNGIGGDDRSRPTVTRVTANSLEVHKKKEQLRRAKEKHLLASLQTFLFADRDKAPTASEVTYNYVLECAVSELRNRDRTRQGLSPVAAADEADTTEAAEGVGGDASGCAAALGGKADTEKHKIKEQQRRAKKRQLLTVLQGLVLGDGAAPKAASVTGNFILELVVEQLQRERDQKVQVET